MLETRNSTDIHEAAFELPRPSASARIRYEELKDSEFYDRKKGAWYDSFIRRPEPWGLVMSGQVEQQLVAAYVGMRLRDPAAHEAYARLKETRYRPTGWLGSSTWPDLDHQSAEPQLWGCLAESERDPDEALRMFSATKARLYDEERQGWSRLFYAPEALSGSAFFIECFIADALRLERPPLPPPIEDVEGETTRQLLETLLLVRTSPAEGRRAHDRLRAGDRYDQRHGEWLVQPGQATGARRVSDLFLGLLIEHEIELQEPALPGAGMPHLLSIDA